MLKDKSKPSIASLFPEQEPENGATKISLKDFLLSRTGSRELQSAGTAVNTSVQIAVAGFADRAAVFQGTDAESKFARNVQSVVESPAFIDDLSESVGTPHDTESEDEFVARAKARMAALLKDRLSK